MKKQNNNNQQHKLISKPMCSRKILLFSLSLLTLISLVLVSNSCRSKHFETEPLFMQYKRVSIEQPKDANGQQQILSESASLTRRRDTTNNDNTFSKIKEYDTQAKLDTSTTYTLTEVTVSSTVSFIPEREGKVGVDFLIRVPRELLSENWRMRLSPLLLANDTTVQLDNVFVTGQNFYDKQLSDSAAYAAYLNSIISKEDYDKAFLDLKGIRKDMRRRQDFYLNLYLAQAKQLDSYRKWYNMMIDRVNTFNAQQAGNRAKLYHQYVIEAQFQKARNDAMGLDTTGIHNKYMKKFERRARLPKYHVRRELNENNIPKKYITYFQNNTQLKDLSSLTVTEKDSIEIAANRYFFDKIAENEYRDMHKDIKYRQIVTYPLGDSCRLDSIVLPGKDFVYLYHQEYAVTPGLKKIRVLLEGKVEAIDQSIYTLPESDTLTFLISTMDQLADTTLITKQTKIYRNMYSKMTFYPEFETGSTDFNVKLGNNRQQIDSLINSYRVFVDKGLAVDSIMLTMTTSLDGSFDYNYKLSVKRSEAIKNYITNNYRDIDAEQIFRSRGKGEDWNTLVSLIRKCDKLQNKDAILQMLGSATFPDDCERSIKQQYRSDYNIIKAELYPQLRKMDVSCQMHRPGMIANDSIVSNYREDYAEGIRLLNERKYWDALQILANYPDYNTALCMSLLGYDERAYNLLQKLEPTGKICYLSSICAYKLDRKEEAAGHLLEALKLDPDLIYRAKQDAETKDLLRSYNIEQQLEQWIKEQESNLPLQEE